MSKFLPAAVVRSVEFRAVGDGEGGDGHTLEGYAAVFGQPTEINSWEGHFHETLAPGAFKKTLRDRTPIIQFDHGHDARTGSVPIAKLVEAKEDGKGLHVKARMFDNPVVEPIRQAIEGGAINGMSFRFQPVRDTWTDAKGKEVQPEELESLLYGGRQADQDRLPLNRLVREVKLFEMGPVVNPAYTGTSVGVRSAADMTEEDRVALVAEYRRTMVAQDDEERAQEGTDTGPADDHDEDDTLEFDHFDCDVPMREDGLPEGYEDKFPDEEEPRSASKSDPKKPYGDVAYADPGYQKDGKKRYPIDTAEHAKAAWDYINKASNQTPYTPEQVASIKSKVKSACAKFGIKISDDSGSKSEKKSAEVTGAAREGTPETGASDAEAIESMVKAGLTPDQVRESLIALTSQNADTEKEPTRKEVASVKTKEELEARDADIVVRLTEIGEGSAERSLDEAEQAEWDDLTKEREAVKKDLKAIEDRVASLRALAEEKGNREGGLGAPAFHKTVDPFDIDAVRMSTSNPEVFARKLVDNAERAIEKAKFGKAPNGYRGKQQGDVATENLSNVDHPEKLALRYLATGSEAYERAYGKLLMHQHNAVLNDEERNAMERAQTLGTNSQGGFAVPFQLDPTVMLTNAGTVNPIRDLARIVQITGKTWEGVTSAGTTATRGSEGATAPDASFTLAQPTLSTNRVQAFIPFTYELDLTWSALRTEITTVLVDAKDREEDSFITGDGTGTNPSGVLLAGSVGVVNTASANGFATADVYALQAALDPRWERNSSWLAHKAIYHKLRQFDTAGGNALWARIGDGQPPALLSYPDYRASAMPSTVATGNKIMVYGDFKNFLIVDRLGMNVELVPQVFDASNSNRPTGQRGVYAVWMNNSVRLIDAAFKFLTVS